MILASGMGCWIFFLNREWTTGMDGRPLTRSQRGRMGPWWKGNAVGNMFDGCLLENLAGSDKTTNPCTCHQSNPTSLCFPNDWTRTVMSRDVVEQEDLPSPALT